MSVETTYSQPHEGIVGEARDDDLLSLDAAAAARRDIMIGMAKVAYKGLLMAVRAPLGEAMFRRMTNPQSGDLVVESTAAYHRDPDYRLKGLGILLACREEWCTTDEQWEKDLLEEPSIERYGRAKDTAWYVQYGSDPGAICRWVNCEFIAVLSNAREEWRP